MRNNRNRRINPTNSFSNFPYRAKTSENVNFYDEKKILRALIYIYYYEKDINKFKNPEKVFYLINYEWMQKFKNFASYEEISKILKNLTYGDNKPITSDNFKRNEFNIVNYLIEKKIKIGDKENFAELSKAGDLIPNEIEKEKINTSPLYYIISSEMKNILEECIFNGNLINILNKYNLLVNGNYILLKEGNVLQICTIEKNLKTTIKYIIIYNSYFSLELELEYLEKSTIENYINQRCCQSNIYSIQTLKKSRKNYFEEIGKLNILKNDGSKDKNEKMFFKNENNNKKANSRNQNHLKREYYSMQNSPEKNEININQNKKIAQSKNYNNNSLESLNNKNNTNSNFKIYNNSENNNNSFNINNKNNNINLNNNNNSFNINNSNNNINLNNNNNSFNINNSNNNININNNRNDVGNKIKNNLFSFFKKKPSDEQTSKMSINLKKEDEPKDINYNNNINNLEKKIDEKFDDLSKKINEKYENNFTQMQIEFKSVKKKLDEVMTYNKQLELNLNKKLDVIIQSQNNINQLTQRLNECMNTIEQLKEENKKLKEENQIKNQNENKICFNFNANENIQFQNVEQIQKKLVLKNLLRPNKNNFQKIIQKKEFITIGLKNIAQAPYINPIIQCLFHSELLTNYFKTVYFDISKANLKFAISFKELIMELSDKNNQNFYPENFINIITEFWPLKKNANINSNDNIYNFLEFILSQLHIDLISNEKEQNNINNIPNMNTQELIAYNEIDKNGKSIITDLFQIINEKIKQCSNKNIKNTKYQYEKLFYLTFDLTDDEINNNETLSIKNCLVQMRKKIVKIKQEYCEICENYCPIQYNQRFPICPKILIIMLKYPKDYDNIETNIEEKLDITAFTRLGVKNKVENQIYNLYGIISKININYNEYIYIAYCKNLHDEKWYKFHDENIERVDDINNDVNFGMPLILFYSKI